MSSDQPNARPVATGLPCPVCKVDLVMTSREGVEIDYCPTCRGVWLDRGELDKIIERSIGGGAQTAPPAAAGYGQQDQGQAAGYAQDDVRHRDGGYGHDSYGGHGQSRGHGGRGGRGSFLSRLFD